MVDLDLAETVRARMTTAATVFVLHRSAGVMLSLAMFWLSTFAGFPGLPCRQGSVRKVVGSRDDCHSCIRTAYAFEPLTEARAKRSIENCAAYLQ
jgi:hypothetical protein